MKEEKIKALYDECSDYIAEKIGREQALIPGSGSLDADILFVLDAPGSKEEKENCPLSGKAYERLNQFLQYCEVSKDTIYITNLMKYRPYHINEKTGRKVGRGMTEEDRHFFTPYLYKEINIIAPKLIVTLGSHTLKSFFINDSEASDLKNQHGHALEAIIENICYTVFPLYHPSSIVYSKKFDHFDIKELKKLINKKVIGSNKQLNQKVEVVDQRDYLEAHVRNESKKPVMQQIHRSDKQEISKKAMREKDKISKEELEVLKPQQEQKVNKSVPQKRIVKAYSPKVDNKNESNNVSRKAKMHTLIIYGGDGYADDPTLEALDRISAVLTELNAHIIRLDLHNKDYSINRIFEEISSANAVILATTIEWLGIGAHMQEFLDQCWKYADKSIFNDVHLMSVAISKQGYERDANHHLIRSWELLGGLEGTSLCANLKTSFELETNKHFLQTIEKKAEDFYRIVTNNRVPLPTSIRLNKVLIEVEQPVHATNETHQSIDENTEVPSLDAQDKTMITNYNAYIEKQQKDIEDISSLFKMKLSKKANDIMKTEPEIFKAKFNGNDTFCKVQWQVTDKKSRNFVLDIKGTSIESYFDTAKNCQVVIQSEYDMLKKIIDGRMTIQRAFMTGEIKAKGDFSIIYKLDQMFTLGQ